jgi:hypothetical protein
MKSETAFFHYGEQLQKTLVKEINEVEFVISQVKWLHSFQYSENGKTYEHQTGYNKAFSRQFINLGWEQQPLLRSEPRLIGDFIS